MDANARAQWLKDGEAKVLAAHAMFGRGTVLVSTANYKTKELRALFYRTLDKAMRRPGILLAVTLLAGPGICGSSM